MKAGVAKGTIIVTTTVLLVILLITVLVSVKISMLCAEVQNNPTTFTAGQALFVELEAFDSINLFLDR